MSDDEKTLMMHAINLSLQKMRSNEGGPFGAVIVKDGAVISEGWNQVTSSNDPTAHAEIMAIRKACEKLNNFSLEGCEIYSSCEPCPMCLSAVYWARLDRLYFANSRDDAKAIGFDDAHIYDEIGKPVHERIIPTFHMHLPEAAAVFAEWRDKADKTEY
jgi:tRNA(Arg) A34 adenosine deaminase TadA